MRGKATVSSGMVTETMALITAPATFGHSE